MPDHAPATTTGGPAQRAWADGILVIMFAAGIALPLLTWLVDVTHVTGSHREQQSSENRRRHELPTWDGSLSSLLTIPKRFEEHFNDHFGYRENLVDLCGRTKVFGLGDSSHRWVMLGRDGWLFFAWDEHGQSARRPRPFQPEELNTWRAVLEARTKWLAQRQCQYVFVVAPEKNSVYPEQLPDWLPNEPCPHTRLVQLKTCLGAGSSAAVLDLGDSLRAMAFQERVFHKTDSHWNGRGAFAAYSAIIHKLSERRPDMQPLPPSRIRHETNVTPGLDLAVLLGMSRHYEEENLDVIVVEPKAHRISEEVEITEKYRLPWFVTQVYENDNRSLPRAVVIGDSFGKGLLRFLAEHFSRLVYLPEHVLDPLVLEREKPDVVIHEMVERKLFTVPPEDPVYQPDYGEITQLAGAPARTVR